jgi:hypothetical protein
MEFAMGVRGALCAAAADASSKAVEVLRIRCKKIDSRSEHK